MIALGLLVFFSLACIEDPESWPEKWPDIDKNLLYSKNLIEQTDESVLYGVEFTSADGEQVYALLREVDPKIGSAVLLPGAGITKEAEQSLAKELARLGVSTLTLDQRGVGETGGMFLTMQEDFTAYQNGESSQRLKMVLDAVRAYQILEELEGGKIIFMGESLGGRIGMIAASVYEKDAGFIGISTGGFGLARASAEKDEWVKFLQGLDPDSYIRDHKGPLVIINGESDEVTPIRMAVETYSLKPPPKKLFSVNTSTHGYTAKMQPKLEEAVQFVFEQ